MNLERFKKIVTGLIAFAGAYLLANAAGAFDGTVFHLSANIVHNITAAGMALGLLGKSVFGMSVPGLGQLPGAPTAPVASPPAAGSNTLKTLVVFLAFASLALPLACATTGPKTPTQAAISNIVDCSSKTIQADIPAILTDVTTALATANYVAGLTQIAVKAGGDVVACAVRQVNGEATARLALAPGAVNQATIAQHAQAWLAGVTFRPAGP